MALHATRQAKSRCACCTGCCCRFLQGLFTLAHDPSPAVRKAVCTGLVAMLMAMPERLEPSMADLIEYMLQSTQVVG